MRKITLIRVDVRAVDKSAGIAGIKPDRLTVVGNRSVIVFFGDLHTGTVAEDLGGARIEADGRIEIRQGALKIAFRAQGERAAREVLSIAGIEPDRFVVICDGAAKILPGEIGRPRLANARALFGSRRMAAL